MHKNPGYLKILGTQKIWIGGMLLALAAGCGGKSGSDGDEINKEADGSVNTDDPEKKGDNKDETKGSDEQQGGDGGASTPKKIAENWTPEGRNLGAAGVKRYTVVIPYESEKVSLGGINDEGKLTEFKEQDIGKGKEMLKATTALKGTSPYAYMVLNDYKIVGFTKGSGDSLKPLEDEKRNLVEPTPISLPSGTTHSHLALFGNNAGSVVGLFSHVDKGSRSSLSQFLHYAVPYKIGNYGQLTTSGQLKDWTLDIPGVPTMAAPDEEGKKIIGGTTGSDFIWSSSVDQGGKKWSKAATMKIPGKIKSLTIGHKGKVFLTLDQAKDNLLLGSFKPSDDGRFLEDAKATPGDAPGSLSVLPNYVATLSGDGYLYVTPLNSKGTEFDTPFKSDKKNPKNRLVELVNIGGKVYAVLITQGDQGEIVKVYRVESNKLVETDTKSLPQKKGGVQAQRILFLPTIGS